MARVAKRIGREGTTGIFCRASHPVSRYT